MAQYSKELWEKIKLERITKGSTYKALEKKYGPHFKTISARAKKECWEKNGLKKEAARKAQDIITTKYGEEIATIYKDMDNLYEKATRLIDKKLHETKPIKEEGVIVGEKPAITVMNTMFSVQTLAQIRKERSSIRETQVYEEALKHNLEIDKLLHKKKTDNKNLRLKEKELEIRKDPTGDRNEEIKQGLQELRKAVEGDFK